jgi:DNA polymerase V
MPLEMQVSAKKNIMSSKSFGKLVTDLPSIDEALANYAARACTKLRKQNSRAQGIYVFVRTNPFRSNEPQYRNGITIGFTMPTSDTRDIAKAASICLRKIYRQGYRYHKAGIMLLDLLPESHEQQHLFYDVDYKKSDKLMITLDLLNERMGKNTVFLAAQGIKRGWQMRCDNRSPRYTTNWNELAFAICN